MSNQIQSDFPMSGNITAVLYDENGDVKETQEFKNLVVANGRTFVASRMIGATAAVMSHMAVGSGATAAAAGDAALISELGRAVLTASASTNVVTYTATFAAGVGTGSINECGIFNAASAGTMLARSTAISLVKGVNDTLALTWTVTINAV